jgi:hypothetical protein
MKLALITTTVNIPSVLALYRRFDPSGYVRFFVAIDNKTPPAAITFLDGLGNCQIVSQTDYKCDGIIGWNSIQRRNLALLEALKWGADIVVSVDDDNIPVDPNYFQQFESLFSSWEPRPVRFDGLAAKGSWFDPGQFLIPPATHRGFPVQIVPEFSFTHVTDARIGVAAGMVLGDPDTSSLERISKRPHVSGVHEILKAGVVVAPGTWTVFNSQNTAFIRDLAPAMMMWPGVGRFDDIFASLLCQRVMRERGCYVHFGRPFTYQQRNRHSLTRDLAGELFGMENVVRFAQWLDRFDFTASPDVLTTVRRIFTEMAYLDWMPPVVSKCGLAWCEDVEGVL